MKWSEKEFNGSVYFNGIYVPAEYTAAEKIAAYNEFNADKNKDEKKGRKYLIVIGVFVLLALAYWAYSVSSI